MTSSHLRDRSPSANPIKCNFCSLHDRCLRHNELIFHKFRQEQSFRRRINFARFSWHGALHASSAIAKPHMFCSVCVCFSVRNCLYNLINQLHEVLALRKMQPAANTFESTGLHEWHNCLQYHQQTNGFRSLAATFVNFSSSHEPQTTTLNYDNFGLVTLINPPTRVRGV